VVTLKVTEEQFEKLNELISMYIYIYICIYRYVNTYIYIYVERAGENKAVKHAQEAHVLKYTYIYAGGKSAGEGRAI